MSKYDIAPKDKLAYYLLKGVNKAIRDYGMIADGDRIAVAVSGGKDSLTLLHLLDLRLSSVPENYDIIAVHVTMSKPQGTSCMETDARPVLEAHFQSLGQAYAFETPDLAAQPDCFRCSYLRRRALFAVAQRLGCNKLALGHHADDAAQTTLLNLLFHGRIETLQPKRVFFDRRFELIRPMIYIPEKRIARFAQACEFSTAPGHCLRGVTSRRTLVKSIVGMLEKEYPKVRINLFRAGLHNSHGTPGSTYKHDIGATAKEAAPARQSRCHLAHEPSASRSEETDG